MRRKTAEALMAMSHAMNFIADAIATEANDIVDKNQRHQYRISASYIMNDVYIKFMKPIIDEYPDLNPDK